MIFSNVADIQAFLTNERVFQIKKPVINGAAYFYICQDWIFPITLNEDENFYLYELNVKGQAITLRGFKMRVDEKTEIQEDIQKNHVV